MKMLSRFWVFFDYLLGIMATIGMVILTGMMLVVCWEVVTRYFLGRGTLWVLEFCEYALLYITFLGSAWLLKREGHVEMDLIILRLNRKTQAIVNGVVSILGAILCSVFAWFGLVVALDRLSRGIVQPTLVAPPDFPLFAVIPVGFFLLFIQFLRRAHRILTTKEAEKPEERIMA
jgi:TRAP-type C4-dicarboxylate transport system permease small subunit